MIFINSIKNEEKINIDVWKGFLKVIAPIAPFISEELWQEINGFEKWDAKNSVHVQDWPKFNPSYASESVIKLAVQINGKVRSEVEIDKDLKEEDVKKKVLSDPKVIANINGKEIKKFIYVPGKIISIVC
jgi:leucyl-tRNA synthetase